MSFQSVISFRTCFLAALWRDLGTVVIEVRAARFGESNIEAGLLSDTKLTKNIIQLVFISDLARDLSEIMETTPDIKG